MILCELIEMLEAADQSSIVPIGFGRPHSYRGYYDELAFEPLENVTVASMLDAAQSAMGKTFSGYKGGDYQMGPYTDCHLAYRGRMGESIGPVLLGFMLGNPTLPKRD